MDPKELVEVLTELAHGRDPDTGEDLATADDLATTEDMVQPRAIRALFAALALAEERARKPTNFGRPWQVEDEARLAAGHAAGQSPAELAAVVGRSKNSVSARLVKLGLLDASEVSGLRY